jgi:UPF0716 family protein affecting phage T7 exclusion
MNIVMAIILSLMLISGSVILKVGNVISEPSLLIIFALSLLLGYCIAHSDKIKVIDFGKLTATLREIKETEKGIVS